MAELTIIVPVYNVEKYLAQCLDSIRAQTFTDFTVLMFNDGSTDGSSHVLRRYAAMDSRFRFIDKHNEGYGATCNRGLDMADTDWVAIVEPDDFIAPDMYADLLQAAHTQDGEKADIVKGSYWEYFEPSDEYSDALRMPNLARYAPRRRRLSTIDGNIQLLIHHPSIWSAIYRRSFLDEQKLRFEEAKGAGWVDNPFYFAALNLSRNILWIPRQYYYYRMTNAEASRYLKDFRIPFDRLREMRRFADTHDISRRVRGVLYARSLDYIDQVVNRYGFDESDPELLGLITEVIDWMDDESIVFSDPAILPRFRTYYLDFTGRSREKVAEHPADADPVLSIVLVMRNDRDTIIPYLQELLGSLSVPCEILAVDCGSHDRTDEAVRQLSDLDGRLRFVSLHSDRLSEGMKRGLADARGSLVMFADRYTAIRAKDLPGIIRYARDEEAVLTLCGIRSAAAERLLQLSSTRSDVRVVNSGRYVFETKASAVRDIFPAIRPNVVGDVLYDRRFLTDHDVTVGESDGTSEAVLMFRVLESLLRENGKMIAMTRTLRGEATDLPVVLPFYRQKLYALDDRTPPFTVPSALKVFHEFPEELRSQAFDTSLRRMIVESFSRDIHSCLTVEALEVYLDSHWEDIRSSVGDASAYELDCEGAFNEFERLRLGGQAFFYRYLYMQTLQRLRKSDERNRRLVLSTRYRLGKKIVDLGKSIAPRRFLTRMYRELTQRLR